MATKKRYYWTQNEKGTLKNFIFTNPGTHGKTIYNFELGAIQWTTSHPTGFKRGQPFMGDRGAGFVTQRIEATPAPHHYVSSKDNLLVYEGPLSPYYRIYTPSPTSFVSISQAVINAMGTNFIAEAIPTNPLSGMGQFLGELKSINPSMPREWRDRASNFREIARDGSAAYLGLEFGWKPFIKDIEDFLKVAKNADQKRAEFTRNSGRLIRRRRSLPKPIVETTITNMGATYPSPSFPSKIYQSPGALTRTTSSSTRGSFSGAFTYYLPEGNTPYDLIRRREAIQNYLYGTRITPDLLWNLAPWSWAADWIGNCGSVIKNWSAFSNDGLVMAYGYVMVQLDRIDVFHLAGVRFTGGQTLDLTQSVRSTTKYRSQATPYGFGANTEQFTARQNAIIGALITQWATRRRY